MRVVALLVWASILAGCAPASIKPVVPSGVDQLTCAALPGVMAYHHADASQMAAARELALKLGCPLE